MGIAQSTSRARLPCRNFAALPLLPRLALAAAALCAGTHVLAAGIDPSDSTRRLAKYRLSETRCGLASGQLAHPTSPMQAQSQPAEDDEPATPQRRPLSWNPALTAAAEQYARAMADQGFFAHIAPDGTTLAQRVDRTKYRWRAIAANLAAGYATLDETLQAWAHSPGHCRNLLDDRYTEFGVARVHSKRAAGRYGVYWVLVLGQPAPIADHANASQ